MFYNFRRLCATLVIAALWAWVVSYPAGAGAPPGQPADLVGIIMSDLPPASSEGYAALKAAAGHPTGQVLEMTRSEMWSIPANRLEPLKIEAARRKAQIIVLDQNWNHALKPMAKSAPMTAVQKSMMNKAMESKAAMGMSMAVSADPRMTEYALTKGMNDPEAPPATLEIAISDTKRVTAVRNHLSKTDDGYVWHGSVEGSDDPVTLMWWPTGRLTGQVTYQGHIYSVRHMGGAMHGVIEVSPRELPPEHAPMGDALRKKMKMDSDPLVTKGDASMLRPAKDATQPRRGATKNLEDAAPKMEGTLRAPREPITVPPRGGSFAGHEGPVEITLLVAYTGKAASFYTDISKDLIALAVEETNQSFRSSGIGYVRIKLVHAYKTDYVEKGSHFDHVFKFADKGDGEMEEVHAKRNRYKADVAVLIVHDPNGCGLAAGVAPPPDRAFAVVHHACAATSYSLAHEIGHILGARHDLGLDDSKEPFPFGHGFVRGKEWRTMMSYQDSCDGCPRLPIWSNPEIKVRGVAAGDEFANNARVIAERAAIVSGYR